ncbi:N-terminal phage integrase SAM-like domain-containing protein [Gordonia westfalica]|uniref:N-terminal phage integrase SAM-like domain-containing protein n=1 Tax=Gordonia westfalica TaxID=158898 RepID=UPI0009458532
MDTIAAPRLKPRTLATYRSTIKHQLIPHVGSKKLGSSPPLMFAAWSTTSPTHTPPAPPKPPTQCWRKRWGCSERREDRQQPVRAYGPPQAAPRSAFPHCGAGTGSASACGVT